LGSLWEVAEHADGPTKLSPGKTAVIAEVSEDWVTPLDTRMEAIAGEVIRVSRFDFEDQQTERSIKEQQAELARLKQEFTHAAADRKARLKAQVAQAQLKLDKAVKQAQERARQVKAEGDAKIKELELQVAKASGEAKARIAKRLADTRADYQRRTALLDKARDLTKQAFAA
jgi:hypothetical protein